MPRRRKLTKAEKEATEAIEQTLTETEATEPIEQTSTESEAKKRRKPTQAETEAKKKKLNEEEYRAEFARKVKTRQKKPIRINKYYYDKAVKKIREYGSKKKRKHPMIERNGISGTRALNSCHFYSLDNLNRTLVQPVVYTPTWNLLVKMLRKALLARNWSYCLRLYDAYLKHGSLRRQQLLYLIRLTFLLMFNLNVSTERLNNFLTVTLSMRSAADQKTFLWSLIELKKFPDVNPKIVETDDKSDEENDPDDKSNQEDDSDDKSDKEDNSDVEDDPDNIILPKEEVISCDDDATSVKTDLPDSA